ncbi:MAG: hypothetical protein HKL87_06910, partial [Acidimicrobiaceae bacterium]|nr:hypothetical protein [Acidimicrobiaceae bacterium]
MNDPRALFAHAATADALYRSTLRALVGERTGYRVWRSHTGREGVEGMDEGWIALWGGHWSDRGTKQHWEREEIVERWRNQARGVEYFGEMRSPSRLVGIDSHAYRAALDGDRWPTRREIVRALAESARDGLTSQQVTTTVDRLFPEITLERGRRESFLGLHDTWSRVASHSRQIDVHERERSGESRSIGDRERGGRERERESEELHRGSR